jgi:ubiquinone biosynthesis O-methyltransferase
VKFTGEYCIPGVSPKRIEDDHVERYRFASQFVSGRRVLDIACGTGYGSHMLGEAGAKFVDGVDILDEVVAYAKVRYASATVHFSLGDICMIETEQPYDVITCFETIEHVGDFNRALANLHSLLNPGGLLLISSPNRTVTSSFAKSIDDKPKNPHHVREFVISELSCALELQGFEIEGTYGQRQRWLFRQPWLQKLQRWIFNPDDCASPALKPVTKREPRYFLIVAKKAA